MENNPNLEVTEQGSHFALGLTFLNVAVIIALLFQLRTDLSCTNYYGTGVARNVMSIVLVTLQQQKV